MPEEARALDWAGSVLTPMEKTELKYFLDVESLPRRCPDRVRAVVERILSTRMPLTGDDVIDQALLELRAKLLIARDTGQRVTGAYVSLRVEPDETIDVAVSEGPL